MSTFANRRSRCKELGKKVPQAYRVYVEDTFLPCDAADARIFAKENFLSLYNALHGTKLTAVGKLKNIRLEQVLYMAFYNDVSYLVDNRIIVLAEHQSTINPNMPSQRLYLLVQSLLTSFCSRKNIVAAWNHRHPCQVQKLTSLSIFEREFRLWPKHRY